MNPCHYLMELKQSPLSLPYIVGDQAIDCRNCATLASNRCLVISITRRGRASAVYTSIDAPLESSRLTVQSFNCAMFKARLAVSIALAFELS